jgi:two-component system, NarL family, response regulator DevR
LCDVRVFIVDDHEIVRERLVKLLNKITETEVVGEAGTVADALAAIPGLRPDLVLLDIRMPDGDGFSVLKRLKALEHAPAVVMLTNHADDYYRRRSQAEGADFFLDKSKQFDEIPGILSQLTETRAHHDG